MSDLFVNYCFASSVVYVFGIGLKHILLDSFSIKDWSMEFVYTVLCVVFSSLSVWGISNLVLVPYGLQELFPLFAVVFVLLFNSIINTFFKILSFQPVKAVLICLIIVVLAVNESVRMSDVLVISMTAVFSMFLGIPIIFTIKQRMGRSSVPQSFRTISVVFFSAAFIFFIVYSFQVAWFYKGVLK
ncbi:MAG: hypothetical protein J6Y75_00300 [Spirochaetaceae bacterium]|nr:hypothetical protein [Spirochaetaceae bacterium]